MYKPKRSPVPSNASSQALPTTFNLLCWNLQKVDFSHYQHRDIDQLLEIEAVHLLSAQEASIQPDQHSFFNMPFVMAPNIETRQKLHGALTASHYQMSPHHQFLTQSRELGFATYKPAIITRHRLSNQQTLTHVNIHAINFVPHYIFKRELLVIWHRLEELEGPMIISGDFNTWNKTRIQTMLNATEKLGLSMVSYPDCKPIKTLNRQPLDHIFYRGLTLLESQAIAVPHISDHNPILAQFRTHPV